MPLTFPMRYRDRQGEIVTTCTHDGARFNVVLDGVQFAGNDLDSLDPVASETAGLGRFTLNLDSLADCTLEYEVPLTLMSPEGEREAVLSARLVLVNDPRRGNLDGESLLLWLEVDGLKWASRGQSGWYEDELLDLQRQLPLGWHMKCCFGCAWSDYSPAGHGMSGDLACFRDQKDAYRKVRGKGSMFSLWKQQSERVHETHCCPQFERREPDTGYRG